MDPSAAAVLRALAFFDLFDRPLRVDEVGAFAWGVGVPDPRAVLARLQQEGVVEMDDDWASLGGLTGKRALQAERERIGAPLVARARDFAAMAARVPFVRGVFLVNSLSLGTNRAGSDIDMLLVARHGRIWIVRALVSLATQLRGWRRHGDKVAGRICLSFFLTDDALNLTTMRLPAGDPYLAYWIAMAVPLCGPIGRAELYAANAWLREDLPGLPTPPDTYPTPPSILERILHGTGLGWVGNSLARIAFRLWRRRRGPDDHAADDRMQKFHDVDRRAEFRSEWRTLCEALGVAT